MSYILGEDRSQVALPRAAIEDYVAADAPVRVIDAFVDGLDVTGLGFGRSAPAVTGRPSYDPRDLLKLYLYGHLNEVRSSRRVEHRAPLVLSDIGARVNPRLPPAVIGCEAGLKEQHQLIEQAIRVDVPGKPDTDEAERLLEWRFFPWPWWPARCAGLSSVLPVHEGNFHREMNPTNHMASRNRARGACCQNSSGRFSGKGFQRKAPDRRTGHHAREQANDVEAAHLARFGRLQTTRDDCDHSSSARIAALLYSTEISSEICRSSP